MIKISVIMPIYNAENYLSVAMDSLINQTLSNIEIICVDDGSTDNSADILGEYAKKDSRIRIITQVNRYAGVARNNGMTFANGKYLSFLDADDYFKPNMLQQAYLCAENTNSDIVVFGGEYFEGELKDAYHMPSLLREELLPYDTNVLEKSKFDSLFHFTTASPWNKLYRRKFVEKHKLKFQHYKRVNDAYFVEIAFALAERIGFVKKDLIAYRTGNNISLQGTNSESPLQFIEVIRDIKTTLVNLDLYKDNKRSFRNFCLSNCIYNLESLRDGIAFEELYNELKYNAFHEFNIAGINAEDYYNKYAYNQYQYIMGHTAVEYWRDKFYGVKQVKYEYLFPFEDIEKGSDIILYAAGNVGKKYYYQVKKSNYCNIVAWVDKKIRKVKNIRVNSPRETDMNNCDFIVIAVESQKASEAIKRLLIEDYSIDSKKIIWNDPVIVV